jgi:hypothetical protein
MWREGKNGQNSPDVEIENFKKTSRKLQVDEIFALSSLSLRRLACRPKIKNER